MTEFTWIFNKKDYMIMYFYAKDEKEVRTRIEKTYRITDKDYTILKTKELKENLIDYV